MKYYLDITLLPEADITLGFIWQKVYQQVHIALVDNKVGDNESEIAVCFPGYGNQTFPLGNKLRLLAKDNSQLTKLNIAQWLNRLQDYVHIKSIQPVPETSSHICFIRQHVKGQMRIEKDLKSKALHWSKISNHSFDYCLKVLEKSNPKVKTTLPYIWLESEETKRRNTNRISKFPLFIKKINVADRQKGVFNCYGLSTNNKDRAPASIPEF